MSSGASCRHTLLSLASLAVLAGSACEDISPVATLRLCEADDPPPDCSCGDPDDPGAARGVRSALCPECQADPPHPDCDNADAGPPPVAPATDGGSRGAPGGDAAAAKDDAGTTRPDSGFEGECRVSRECPNDRPVCLLTEARCVECIDAGDCASRPGEACDPVAHACVDCLESSDCGDEATPVCDTEAQRCVQCLAAGDCTGSRALCDVGAQQCVECLAHADCLQPGAARCEAGTCVPCTEDAQCVGVDEGGLCDDDGRCVECTGTRYEACGTDALGVPYVCDSLARTCTRLKEGSGQVCAPCVSDAQCAAGQSCVPQDFDGTFVGHFCHWERNAGVGGAPSVCSLAPPYVATLLDVQSIDGVTAVFCGLLETTCIGYDHFGSASVDCEPTPDAPDDSLCGAEGVADAYCRPYDDDGMGDTFFRCTVPCVSNDDCRRDFSCDLDVTPSVCRLWPDG